MDRTPPESTDVIRLMSIVGTRPEAIKMAPVIRLLKRTPWCEHTVVATAQHRELLDQVLSQFSIGVDVDLGIMTSGQSLALLTARLCESLDLVLAARRPHMIVAQGDTTTVMIAALAAFYRRIPFAHVEAGLRTGNLANPFPEELNRTITGRIAALNFAPTDTARAALLHEGVSPERVFVTGNTIVDAFLETAATKPPLPLPIDAGQQLVLLTVHRRENFGAPLARIFRSVLALVQRHSSVEIVYPIHPNPEVRAIATQMLAGKSRIHMIEPLDYPSLVAVLHRASFVLTDSGGLQEEAPIVGKPVLVLREETERHEGVAAGTAKLVGTDEAVILTEASRLVEDTTSYAAMARRGSLYGDGRAAERIVDILRRYVAGSLATSPEMKGQPKLDLIP